MRRHGKVKETKRKQNLKLRQGFGNNGEQRKSLNEMYIYLEITNIKGTSLTANFGHALEGA